MHNKRKETPVEKRTLSLSLKRFCIMPQMPQLEQVLTLSAELTVPAFKSPLESNMAICRILGFVAFLEFHHVVFGVAILLTRNYPGSKK
jgi:hypothetical protein